MPYRAEASATLLHLATVAAPRPDAFRGLRLGAASSRIDTAAHPQAIAAAAYLTSTPWLAGAPETTVLRKAGRPGPASGMLVRRVAPLQLPALNIGSGRLRSTAAWSRHAEQVRGPLALTSSSADLSRVSGYPVPGTALFSLRSGGTVVSRTDIVDVDRRRSLGIRAVAQVGLDTLTLFPRTSREVTLRFITRPALTAIATGTRRSSVRYVAPQVAISGPGGRAYRLGADRGQLEIPLVSFGTPFGWRAPNCECDGQSGGRTAVLRISQGGYQQQVTPVSVRASATALRIQVVDSSRSVLDMNLGTMDVTAAAPVRGLRHFRKQGAAPAGFEQDPDDGTVVEESDPPAAAKPTDDAPTDAASTTPTEEAVAPTESGPPVPQEIVPSDTPADVPEQEHQPELPVTGTSLGLLIAAGVGLVGVGWVTRRKFRRRTR